MKKLYEKSEIWFSVIWIVLYVVLLSNADSISEQLGVQKSVTAPLCVIMAAVLLGFVFKNGLAEKYGLCVMKGHAGRYLMFVPLIALSTVNFWNGVTMNMTVAETALYIISMLCVGFIEEIIFRGFLFKAMAKDNVKSAIIVSSLTFGIGHIVNLLNGEELLATLLQVCYAVAMGYLFTIIFHKSGSLIPCILAHSFVNSTSVFGREQTPRQQIIISAVLAVGALVYALVILALNRNKMVSSAEPTPQITE